MWSKWWCVRKTVLMAPSGTPALLSCTTTPRPASNRIFSSPSLISVVVAMRRGSGRGPPVPSSMTSMTPPPARRVFTLDSEAATMQAGAGGQGKTGRVGGEGRPDT